MGAGVELGVEGGVAPGVEAGSLWTNCLGTSFTRAPSETILISWLNLHVHRITDTRFPFYTIRCNHLWREETIDHFVNYIQILIVFRFTVDWFFLNVCNDVSQIWYGVTDISSQLINLSIWIFSPFTWKFKICVWTFFLWIICFLYWLAQQHVLLSLVWSIYAGLNPYSSHIMYWKNWSRTENTNQFIFHSF